MAVWSTEDWSDLGSAALSIIAFVSFILLVPGLIRKRKKQPFWQPRDGFDLLFWLMIGGILAIDPINRIFDRHQVPGWVGPACFGVVILAISQAAMRSLAKLQAQNLVHAVDNPDGDGRDMQCNVDLAPEDRKIHFRVIAGSLVLLLVSGGSVFLAINMLEGAGATGMVALLAFSIAMLAGLLWLAKGHWPAMLNLRGEIDIAATPEQVWDIFHYRETDQYYRSIVRRVERLDRPGDVYRLHYYNDERCPDCGLHKNPVAPGRTCLVEVDVAQHPRHMVTRSIPFLPTGDTDPMMAYETSDMHYAALPGGGCRVSYVNTVARSRAWLALLLKMGDPIGEHLRDLKAHVEGGQGDTIYDRAERELDCARHVPQHCGCPPQMAGAMIAA